MTRGSSDSVTTESVESTSMFYEGMIYSVMDLGGYLFSGYVTSKFDSFKSA